MAEGSSNVRLVRCPKCGNLLPELHDFSVYQCGGCGTVLRGTILSISLYYSSMPYVEPSKIIHREV